VLLDELYGEKESAEEGEDRSKAGIEVILRHTESGEAVGGDATGVPPLLVARDWGVLYQRIRKFSL